MGMAAGQARLLSITSRLTDNELRSQMLTNSKLRLATKSSEASNEYMDALNTQQLVYSTYDSNGAKVTEALTPNVLMTYGDLKNQYVMVNSAGQILVTATDVKNYVESTSMAEFMYKYGIPEVDNPKYTEALIDIYGKTSMDDGSFLYEKLYDENNPLQWNDYFSTMTDADITNLETIVSKNPEDVTEADAQQFTDAVNNWTTQVTGNELLKDYANIGGSFGNYLNNLLTLPDVEFPDKDDSEYKDVSGDVQLAEKFDLASKQCYENCHPPYNGSGQECYLHVLAYLLDYDGNLSGYPKNFNTTVSGNSITVDRFKITGAAIYNQTSEYPVGSGNMVPAKDMMQEVSEYLWDPANGCMAPEDESDTTTYNSSTAEKLLSNYKWVDSDGDGVYEKTLKTWPERIIDTYYAVQNRDALGLQYESLLPILDEFQTDMKTALSSEFNEDRYNQAVKTWQDTMSLWLKKVKDSKKEYLDDLSQIPAKKVPDEKDARYQWYKNLWYRMGGIDETNSDKSGNKFVEIDSMNLNNSEWLQFALEQGIITLEQATFSENGSSVYPNMGTYDWKSISYSSTGDIVSQEDEAAIAKAEIKYQNAIRDIENEDKKIDQDLKKLDTEHSALQTEYESIKGIIDKNVERSFKAFS